MLVLLAVIFIGMASDRFSRWSYGEPDPATAEGAGKAAGSSADRCALAAVRPAAGPLHPAGAPRRALRAPRRVSAEARHERLRRARPQEPAERAVGRGAPRDRGRFRETVLARGGQRLAAGLVLRDAGGIDGQPAGGGPGATTLAARSAPPAPSSATPSSRSRRTCPAAHLFEREIAEQCGVVPHGHPWLKPLRRHPPDHLAPGRKPLGGRPGRRTPSSGSRARRSTRSRSGRCTPASSSRGTSASSATARRCCSSRSCSAISIAASSGCWRPPARSGRAGGRIDRGRHGVGHAAAHCGAIEALAGAGRRRGRRRSAASRWSSSGWPTTSGTSARSPGTWRSSPARPISAGCGASASTSS